MDIFRTLWIQTLIVIVISVLSSMSFPDFLIQSLSGNRTKITAVSGHSKGKATEVLAFHHSSDFHGSFAANKPTKTLCYDFPAVNHHIVIRCQSGSMDNPKFFFPSMPLPEIPEGGAPSKNHLMELDPYGNHLVWLPKGSAELYVTNLETDTSLRLSPTPPGSSIQMFAIDWFVGIFCLVYSDNKSVIVMETIDEESMSRKRIALIRRETGTNILGIACDLVEKNVYWAENKFLFCASYQGRNPRRLPGGFQYPPINRQPIQHFLDAVYWMDGNDTNGSIIHLKSYTKKGLIDTLRLAIDEGSLSQLTIYENQANGAENKCIRRHCSHLCLPLYQGRVQCACPQGFTLKPDNSTCHRLTIGYVTLDSLTADNTPDGSLARSSRFYVIHMQKQNTFNYSRLTNLGDAEFGSAVPRGLVPASIDGQFCYFAQNDTTVRCFGNHTVEVLIPPDIIPEIWNEQVIHLRVDDPRHFATWFLNETGCIKFYDSQLKQLITVTCLVGIWNERHLLIDDVNWMVFWESENGSIFSAAFGTEREITLVDSTSTTRCRRSRGPCMAVDPLNKKLYRLSQDTLSVIYYNGSGNSSFNRSSFWNGFHVEGASSLIFSDDFLYWIEHDSEKDRIVTVDAGFHYPQVLFESPGPDYFSFLALQSSVKGQKKVYCVALECQKFCSDPDSGSQAFYCPCPPQPVMQPFNRKWDGFNALMAVAADDDQITISFKLTGSDPKTLLKLPPLLRIQTVPANQILFFLASKESETFCWITPENATGIACKSHYLLNGSAIYMGRRGDELLGISVLGDQVYWLKLGSFNNKCVSLTSLSLKVTIELFCQDIQPPFALDTSRQILFWYGTRKTQTRVLTYRHLRSNSTSHERYLKLRKWETPGSDPDCSSIALDEFKGILYAILGTTLIGVEYTTLFSDYPLVLPLYEMTYTYVGGLQYFRGYLTWIGGSHRRGEFIEYLPAQLYLLTRAASNQTALRLPTNLTSKVIYQFQVYQSRAEEYTWHNPCTPSNCSHFCTLEDPLTLVEANERVCMCPSNYKLEENNCTKKEQLGEPDDEPILETKLEPKLKPKLESKLEPDQEPTTHSKWHIILAYAIGVILAVILVFIFIFAAYLTCTFAWSTFQQSREIRKEIKSMLEGNPVASVAEQASSEGTDNKPDEHSDVDGVVRLTGNLSNMSFQPFRIAPEDIKINYTTELGKGNFGEVYPGVYKGERVAVKTFKRCIEQRVIVDLIKELKVMAYLGAHDNIVRFIGADVEAIVKGKVKIVLEFSPQGSLESYLKACNDLRNLHGLYSPEDPALPPGTTIVELTNYALQVAAGMHYLESRKVVHGDLAARNVLVFKNGLILKICDFGFSRNLYQREVYLKENRECALPIRWCAFETLDRYEFSSLSDVWSYGVTLWEIFTLGGLPYPELNWGMGLKILEMIRKGKRLPKPELASIEIYEYIMIPCWIIEPQRRPTFSELMDLITHVNAESHVNVFAPIKKSTAASSKTTTETSTNS